MRLDPQLGTGWKWWKERLGKEVSVTLRPFVPTMVLTTDASGSGWGATVSTEKIEEEMGETWETEREKTSSNLRELRAVKEALIRLTQDNIAPHTDILVRSDNLTTVANINRRSCAVSLLPEMLRLFDILDQHALRLRVSYIPGKENVAADALSRQTDASDYAMDEEVFLSVLEEMGISVGIDLFATAGNRKSRRFYSWRPARGSLGTDALAQSWKGEEDMYAFPPTVLIPKILKKLREEGGRMLIITPAWAAAAWMRELEEMTEKRIGLGGILEFARRGKAVPRENTDPPGEWIASLIRA
jgi:ribonuclease HI